MREQTVAMYCVLDDLIRFTRPAGTRPSASGRRLTDAQVLTTALVAARFFGGNLVIAKHYMEQHWGQNRLDKSGFTRRLHALTDTLLALFATVGDLLKHLHPEARYVLDSFPVAVCPNTRIPRCKLLTGKAYHGRCASKRSWFYGLKVQVITTSNGLPVEFYIHAGAESEQTGRRGLALDLPAGSVLYTDAGYTDYGAEDLFNEASGSQQQTAPASGAKLFDSILSQRYRNLLQSAHRPLSQADSRRYGRWLCLKNRTLHLCPRSGPSRLIGRNLSLLGIAFSRRCNTQDIINPSAPTTTQTPNQMSGL